jgi:hypothetical protein
VFDLYEAPAPYGEVIGASLRRLSVAPQAVQVRVDATMIRFNVQALLVASNSNALRRFHYFFDVWFTDDLATVGSIVWPDEAVIFTDSGVEVTIPFHWGDDEQVIFREDAFSTAFAINNTEFVALADYAIDYLFDFLTSEAVRLSDISVAWSGVHHWDEAVTFTATVTAKGDVSDVETMAEYVTLSEVLIGGPIITLADAVFMAEFWTRILEFQTPPEFVTFTDKLEVSEVAATDSRPGAFIPGSALLGSPQ